MAKLTPEQRELKRINQFIRRATKRGYIFEDLPNFRRLDIDSLKGYTPDELYKRSFREMSGQIVSGTTARTIERRVSARKAAETRAINRGLDIIDKTVDRMTDIPDKVTYRKSYRTLKGEFERSIHAASAKMLEKLDTAIKKYGKTAVAKNLNDNAEQINKIIEHLLRYGIDALEARGQLNMKLTELATLLAGGGPLSAEEMRDLGDMEEDEE